MSYMLYITYMTYTKQTLEQIESKILQAQIIQNFHQFEAQPGEDDSYFSLIIYDGTVDFNQLLRLQVAGFKVINITTFGKRIKINLSMF